MAVITSCETGRENPFPAVFLAENQPVSIWKSASAQGDGTAVTVRSPRQIGSGESVRYRQHDSGPVEKSGLMKRNETTKSLSARLIFPAYPIHAIEDAEYGSDVVLNRHFLP